MSLWRLIRGEHGVLAALASTAAYVIAGGQNAPHLALLAVATFLAEAGLFAHNDLCNLEEDRVNRLDAPLVRGAVTVKTAKAVAYGALGVGTLAAAIIGPLPLAIYLTAAIFGTLYNARLKRLPLVGNFTVAFLTSMTYIFGAVAAGNLTQVVALLFISSLIANVGRELVKTAIDYQGDLKAGLKTAATLWGPRPVARAGALVTLVSVPFGVALVYHAVQDGFYVLATGAAATSLLLAYYSIHALRGTWRKFKSGALLAFGITLVALVIEALLLYLLK